jgi:hypothetical protein
MSERPSYAGKPLAGLTIEDREQLDREWAAAESRVRNKQANQPPRPAPVKHKCEGCAKLYPRGAIRPVERAGSWRWLCPDCRRRES